MVLFRIDNLHCKYHRDTLVDQLCEHKDMENDPKESQWKKYPIPRCIEEKCPLLLKEGDSE